METLGMRYFIVSFVAKPKLNLSQLTYGDTTMKQLGYPSAIIIRKALMSLGYVKPAILNIIEVSKTDYESFVAQE